MYDRKHEQTHRAQWALTLAMCVLIGVLCVGMVFGGPELWTDKGPSTWGDGAETVVSGGMLVPGTTEGHGIRMMSAEIPREQYAAYGVSPAAENAVTLTATIDPPEATIRTVTWATAFIDPSSAWATGKTVGEYVTVTPTEEGALTATVQCLQAFGEKIKITVTSTDNPEAQAECICDFQKRVTKAELKFDGGTPVWKPSTTSPTGHRYTTSFEYTYGTGTVEPDVTEPKATFGLTISCSTALSTWHSRYVSGTGALLQPGLGTSFNGTYDLVAMYKAGASLYLDGYLKFIQMFIYQGATIADDEYKKYAKYLDSLITELNKHLLNGFQIKVECTVDGKVQTFYQDFRLDLSEFNARDLYIAVSDAALNDTDILFK